MARGVQKLRRMAGEFRAQADELVREANLDELRQQIHDIRSFNVRDEFEKAVDKDGSLRRSFDDPLRDTYTPPPPPAATEGAGAPAADAAASGAPPPADSAVPAFIPPSDAAAAGPPPPAAQPPAAPEPAAVPAPTDTAAPAPTPAPVHRT